MVDATNRKYPAAMGGATPWWSLGWPEFTSMLSALLVGTILTHPVVGALALAACFMGFLLWRKSSHNRRDYLELAWRRFERHRRYRMLQHDVRWAPYRY